MMVNEKDVICYPEIVVIIRNGKVFVFPSYPYPSSLLQLRDPGNHLRKSQAQGLLMKPKHLPALGDDHPSVRSPVSDQP